MSLHKLLIPRVSAVNCGIFSWYAYVATHYIVCDPSPYGGPYVERAYDVRMFVGVRSTRRAALRLARRSLNG